MNFASPELQDALAAEYVLGTLRGRARQRLAREMRTNPALAAAVARWEARIVPLAERLAPVEPPQRVWTAIERRIGRAGLSAGQSPTIAPAAAGQSWWESLVFWRNWGLAASAAACALLAVLLVVRPSAGPAPDLVAVLATPENVPRMVVERSARTALTVKVVKPWNNLPGHSLELWVIPKEGGPRSLGIVAHDRDSRVDLAQLEAKLVDATAFAISKEPPGGSPTGAPTGPVLCSGVIAQRRV